MPKNTYTSGSGTWPCPAGFNQATIEAWGAGGGGGGSNNTTAGAGGGGGAAYARVVVTGLVPGNTYPYVIPAGGAGGTANQDGTAGLGVTFNNNSGGNVSTIIGVNGGGGGLGGHQAGNKAGLGGAANGTLTSYKGGNGANNVSASVGGGAGAGAGNANAGADTSTQTGATGTNGGGTGGNGGSSKANGNNYQSAPGAGGGGAGNSGSGGRNRVGGTGASGQLVITWDAQLAESKHAYLAGANPSYPASSNKPAYLHGIADTLNNKPAYTRGQSSLSGNKPAYLTGVGVIADNKLAFLAGQVHDVSSKPAYTAGYVAGIDVSDSAPAYLRGGMETSTSKPAWILGIGNLLIPDGAIGHTGTWKNELESETNIWTSIDESIASDADYIYDTNPTDDNYYEFSLSNPPGVPGDGDVVVLWRGKDTSGLGQVQAKIELRQGTSTVIASQQQTLTSTPQTFYFQLTPAERANITDWPDLRIRITEIIS